MNNRPAKTFLLLAIVYFSAMASPAMAFFNDSFDTYSAGDLFGNGYWTPYQQGTAKIAVVATSTGKIIQTDGAGWAEIYAEYLPENTIDQVSIDFFHNCAGTENTIAQFNVRNPTWQGAYLGILEIGCQDAVTAKYQIQFGNESITDFATSTDNTWNRITLKWNCLTNQFWAGVNGVFSPALSPLSLGNPYMCSNGFHALNIYSSNQDIIFDNLSDQEVLPASSTIADPVISTFYPVNCAFNYLEATGSPEMFDFEANLNISNPVYSSTTWQLIYLNFQDSYNAQTSQFPVAINSAPDSIINVTSSVSLASSSYMVYYSLAGLKNGAPAYYMSYCDPTFLGTINVAQQIEIANMPAFTPEDCSGMATLERLVCEIRNDLKGLFYPTPLKVSQLKQNMDLIGSKFPFNYISVIKSFFQDVSDGLNKNEAISISIFGSTAGDLSFAPLASTTRAYGGSTLSILLYIKGFFTLLIFLIILKWFISYVKRVFK